MKTKKLIKEIKKISKENNMSVEYINEKFLKFVKKEAKNENIEKNKKEYFFIY